MNDNDELKFLEKVYSTYTVDTSKQTEMMRRLVVKLSGHTITLTDL